MFGPQTIHGLVLAIATTLKTVVAEVVALAIGRLQPLRSAGPDRLTTV